MSRRGSRSSSPPPEPQHQGIAHQSGDPLPRTTDHIKEHHMPHTSLTPAKYSQHLTSHESVKFPDGDHVIVHRSPYGVQVTGFLHGDWIEESWDHHAAQEQAR